MDAIGELLEEVRTLVIMSGGELAWFGDKMSSLDQFSEKPQSLPVCEKLAGLSDFSSEQTRTVVRAIVKAASQLRWQQSYSKADGFDQHYLNNYGWFNLVSPDGPFVSTQFRVSVGYWGDGLEYRQHWHEPEEFYLVLAGNGKFISQGRPPRQCHAADVVHHQPNQKHAIEMNCGPMLAAAFWRGDGLLAKPRLEDITCRKF